MTGQVNRSSIEKGYQMLERLGLVLYWGASLLALLIVGIAAWNRFVGTVTDPLLFWLSVEGGAMGVWLVGRAVLFVLFGR